MVERVDNKISLAVASGHNIQPQSQQFIIDAGFQVVFKNNGQIHAKVERDPLIGSITTNRGKDIPLRLIEGVNKFGILGRDILREAQLGGLPIEEVVALDFSLCQVSLEIPEHGPYLYNTRHDLLARFSPYRNPHDLDGLRIATSLPNITRDYFGQHDAAVRIVEYSGKEEGAPAAGAAEAVVAIWSTGKTARENGLRRMKGYERIRLDGHDYSEAVLVASSQFLEEHGSEIIVDQFIERCRKAAGHVVDLGMSGDNDSKSPRGSRRWCLRSAGTAVGTVAIAIGTVLQVSNPFSTRTRK